MDMRISRVQFGKYITEDFCKSNGKLDVSTDSKDETYISVDSIGDLIDIAKKVGGAITVCEDGELWIDK
ncbi:MAG: hypothetical protein GY799_00520 [Desulfobulbaceae bacterium]|nr:hypothetical protein [Desulfobulbaceae bacterium]